MAVTIDHSSIWGLATAFHLFSAGLPRSNDGDHPQGCPCRTVEGSPHRAPRIALPVRWQVYWRLLSDEPPGCVHVGGG
jgi:hypothetical protein